MTDAERIAGTLSGKWNIGEVASGLIAKGLIEPVAGYFVQLTPNGLAVRALLTEGERK